MPRVNHLRVVAPSRRAALGVAQLEAESMFIVIFRMLGSGRRIERLQKCGLFKRTLTGGACGF